MANIDCGYLNGTPYAYTTIATAITAASAGDTVTVYESSAYGSAVWWENVQITKSITLIGGLPMRKITICNTSAVPCVYLRPGASVTALTMGIRNLTVRDVRGKSAISFYATVPTDGHVCTIENCDVSGSIGFTNAESYATTTITFDNCIFSVSGYGYLCSAGRPLFTTMRNCSFVDCNASIAPGANDEIQAINVLVDRCRLGTTNEYGTATYRAGSTNNAGQYGAGIPGANPVTLTTQTRGYIFDGGLCLQDCRLDKATSDLLTLGADSGLTADIDGQAFGGVFPLGASAGIYVAEGATPAQVIVAGGGSYVETAEADVKIGVLFGPASTYTGSYSPSGVLPTTPVLTLVNNNDGTATATITGSDGGTTNTLYSFPKWGGALAWSEVDDRVGDGDITVSGVGDYVFAVISDNGIQYSFPTDPLPLSITNGRRTCIRDAAARAEYQAAKQSPYSLQVKFYNGRKETDYVEVWATIEGASVNTQLRNTAATDTEEITFHIPRQIGFPPDVFYPGGRIAYGDKSWEIQDVTPSNGINEMSSTFRVECATYRTAGDF